MLSLIRKLIGSRNDRELKRFWPIVAKVNEYGAELSALSDEALREKTSQLKAQLRSGSDPETPSPSDSTLSTAELDASLDQIEETEERKQTASLDANRLLADRLWDLLPEAFAVVREAAKRTVQMRPFDVQVLGGIALHLGKISEMKTGEGKTLVATLPAYLNALTGRGVHIITVNDYLAKRDSQWMGEIFRFLGLSVGLIQHNSTDRQRQEAYHSDITYGTNNEFGFDYLRDNMKFDPKLFVQRPLHYAIVDEVDSILIDEARTPLIISGPAEESTELYYRVNQLIPSLHRERDYTLDEKTKTVTLTEEGNARVEKRLGVENLYDLANLDLVHHTLQALKAHTLFRRDVDYMVKDGEVMIVDEFTGRLMPGRRWSDGLHQAVEAKEGVKIANENQTLASITFQNYFRMYDKLAGMTGTADTEAAEFDKIYKLEVMIIPPNRSMSRRDDADLIYRTEKEKFTAIVEELIELNKSGHPVLVGTISIEKSEQLSSLLKQRGVKHSVLNAKYHELEAEIIAQAGRFEAVTIATNMAGRGTDILLGGNSDFLFRNYKEAHPDADPAALELAKKGIETACEAEKARVITLGGLRIIGTERHESRRIDNQLRGRSGRQGDPGSSRFYLSLEDDLLRIFGSERISKVMEKLGMEEGVPIEHRMVTRAIENAQRRVEGHNFDIRKHLLEYDDVMNKQRTLIYRLRHATFSEEEFDEIRETMREIVETAVNDCCPKESYPEEWNLDGLAATLSNAVSVPFSKEAFLLKSREELFTTLTAEMESIYQKRAEQLGPGLFHHLEKQLFLRTIDTHWKDHLLAMDSLKEGIGLRGYGQKDPLSEYKREGFDLFVEMVNRVKQNSVEQLFRLQTVQEKASVKTMAKEAPSASSIVETPRPSERASIDKNAGVLLLERTLFPKKAAALQYSRGEEKASAPAHRETAKIGRNDPCSCGSGKKYKKCHGA
jgi:preprotein translocase subunit SecA